LRTNKLDTQKIKETLTKEWADEKTFSSSSQAFTLGIIVSFILIPFDYVSFGPSFINYLPFRASSIILFGSALGAFRMFGKNKQLNKYYLISLTAGLLFYNGFYFYFFESAKSEFKITIQAAIFMNIFATGLLSFKLKHVHTALSFFYLVSSVSMSVMSLENTRYYESFALWTVVMYVFFYLQRRIFFKTLQSQFVNFLNQYPPAIARTLTIHGDSDKFMEPFQPRLRPCVCVSMDWRSFQEFAKENSPEKIVKLIESSHEVILDLVYKNIPEETFYADWSADEFFITIYSNSDNISEIGSQSLKLISDLQYYFHFVMDIVNPDFAPVIDIGASSGEAIVGLLGPNNMKKMTALGSVGGTAKRLETEAKTIRSEQKLGADTCVVVIDGTLFKQINIHEHKSWTKRIALSSNIKGADVFYSKRQHNFVPLENAA
jgi:hypothetical protein